ncbi:MAG: hypothetical protein ABSE17_03930 [Candidatus Levyibacteriota bacterium]
MNKDQLSLTKAKFPTLFSFSQDYEGKDKNDIRQYFRDKPTLILGEGYWLKYERALQLLPVEDKNHLLNKLKTLTKKLSEQEGWPHFEEKLNEALVYEYLQKEGYRKIKFIQENSRNGRKPDFEILNSDFSLKGLIEVKTIRYSLDEFAAVKKETETGEGRFLQMQAKGLYEKINDALITSAIQLKSYSSSAIEIRGVYLFLNLDSGILMDLIFTPTSDLEQFLCKTKKDLYSKEQVELKIYLLSGIFGDPKEFKCKD